MRRGARLGIHAGSRHAPPEHESGQSYSHAGKPDITKLRPRDGEPTQPDIETNWRNLQNAPPQEVWVVGQGTEERNTHAPVGQSVQKAVGRSAEEDEQK